MPPSLVTAAAGPRLAVAFSDGGQVMNGAGLALSSVEQDGTYEHLATGELDEGYCLFYRSGAGEGAAWDLFQRHADVAPVSARVLRSDAVELVKLTEGATADGRLAVRQLLSWGANTTRINVVMEITNTSGETLRDVVVKRYADLDVDTGGSHGWAGFRSHWRTSGDSVMAWNDPTEAPRDHLAHIVNMVALPGDLPLTAAFAGLFGHEQFAQRGNPNPVPSSSARVDGVGILAWEADRLRSGQTVRVLLYYDAYCLGSAFQPGDDHAGSTGEGRHAGRAGRVGRPAPQSLEPGEPA